MLSTSKVTWRVDRGVLGLMSAVASGGTDDGIRMEGLAKTCGGRTDLSTR